MTNGEKITGTQAAQLTVSLRGGQTLTFTAERWNAVVEDGRLVTFLTSGTEPDVVYLDTSEIVAIVAVPLPEDEARP